VFLSETPAVEPAFFCVFGLSYRPAGAGQAAATKQILSRINVLRGWTG